MHAGTPILWPVQASLAVTSLPLLLLSLSLSEYHYYHYYYYYYYHYHYYCFYYYYYHYLIIIIFIIIIIIIILAVTLWPVVNVKFLPFFQSQSNFKVFHQQEMTVFKRKRSTRDEDNAKLLMSIRTLTLYIKK